TGPCLGSQRPRLRAESLISEPIDLSRRSAPWAAADRGQFEVYRPNDRWYAGTYQNGRLQTWAECVNYASAAWKSSNFMLVRRAPEPASDARHLAGCAPLRLESWPRSR